MITCLPELNVVGSGSGAMFRPGEANESIHGKRGITADTPLRLSKALGRSAAFWKNLQSRFDFETTENEIELAEIRRSTATLWCVASSKGDATPG